MSTPTIYGESIYQHTLNATAVSVGIGVHSGKRVRMSLRPAEPGSGIIFERIDLPRGSNRIAARWQQVASTTLCTEIANAQGARVSTIEHLMAAFRGCCVDNVLVQVDGPELPVMDGSSGPFVQLIRSVGIRNQWVPRRLMRIRRTVKIAEEDRFAMLLPYLGFRLTARIEFPDPSIGTQERTLRLRKGTFEDELSSARTFGFVQDLEYLKSKGLGKGGSTRTAVIIDQGRILNPEGLRYPDEFVRHKILDAVGDLYMAEGPILGHYFGHKPGHKLNRDLLERLSRSPETWDWYEPAPPLPPARAMAAVGADAGQQLHGA